MASVETAAEHERILREIESTDTNCIGPTLRWVRPSPPGGCPPRGAPRWRQLNGRRQPAEGARLASTSNSCEPAQNFNGRVSIIGQLAG